MSLPCSSPPGAWPNRPSIVYADLKPAGNLYISLTGGTGLATQREPLGSYSKGKVKRLAEIVAGVALAGEISLAAAISSWDWLSSPEEHGPNR